VDIAKRFFDEIWGDLDQGWMLLWDLATKNSHWFQSTSLAAHCLKTDSRDIYMGAGLSPADLGAHLRCKAGDIASIAGFWADLDHQYEGAHQKTRLPGTLEDCHRILEGLPLKPTLVVKSGHGLQPWWLFQEPVTFEDATGRTKMQGVATGWQGAIQAVAGQHGWEVDSVADFARVLRVPGTINAKVPDQPVPVEVLTWDGPRYSDHTQFADFVEVNGLVRPADQGPAVKVDDLALTPGANPPVERWAQLLGHRVAKRTWEQDRDDLKDSSPSGYSMALASLAVKAGWSDQEVTDLIIAWRRKHRHNLKLDRLDWYERTIGNARKGSESDQGIAQLEAIEVNGGSQEDVLKSASKTLGVQISGFIQMGRQEPEYFFKFPDGRLILIGGIEVLDDCRAVYRLLYTQHHIGIKVKRKSDWITLLNSLLRVVVVEDGDIDSPRENLQYWVEKYTLGGHGAVLADDRKHDTEDLKDAIARSQPFVREGQIHIHLLHFQTWLAAYQSERGVKALMKRAAAFKLCGWHQKTVADGGSTKSYWRTEWWQSECD
jgi:hypothetical protein